MGGQGSFGCDLCPNTFKAKYNLTRHQETVHEGPQAYLCTQLDPTSILCGKTFKRSDNLKQHMRSHTTARQFPCSDCTKIYASSSKLKLHRARAHAGGKAAIFKCPHCEHGSESKWNLGQHMQKHTGKWAFACEHCRFKTSTQVNLVKHVSAKHDVLPRQLFPCDRCKYSTSRKSNLTAHKLRHADGRSFPCQQCDKIYKNKSQLLIHQRIHSGWKLLKCEPCDETFVTGQLLKRHKRSVSHRLDSEQQIQRLQFMGELKRFAAQMLVLEAVEYKVKIKWREGGKMQKKRVLVGSNSEFLILLKTFPVRHQANNWENSEAEEQDFPPTKAQAKAQDRAFNRAMRVFHPDRCPPEWRQENDPEGTYVKALEGVAKDIARRKTDLKYYCEMLKQREAAAVAE